MEYWIVFKRQNGEKMYISEIDKFGCPVHTTNEKDAMKFIHLNIATVFYNFGYAIKYVKGKNK